MGPAHRLVALVAQLATLLAVLVALSVGSAPTHVAAAAGADGGTTSTIVASEPPAPGGREPEAGAIVTPTDGSSFARAWWLVAFGGLQLIGLFFITRRARSRLADEDAHP